MADLGSGSGAGSGAGYGDGDGYGYGHGAVYGSGYGSGYGHGAGYGHGYGHGHGYGSCSGYGYGAGHGYGDGAGDGFGYGEGYYHGSGSGHGDSVPVATLGEYEVCAVVTPWGRVVSIGCQMHGLDTWRERWREIAREHGVTVSAEEVARLIALIEGAPLGPEWLESEEGGEHNYSEGGDGPPRRMQRW